MWELYDYKTRRTNKPEQGKWKRVPPGSVGEALWKVACNTQ
ncbi:MAG: surface-adhesin E family protein [Nitrospiraceae bacterium]